MALKPIIAGGFYTSSPAGAGGDMLAATYDPAGIAAQVAGRTVANDFLAAQTISVAGAASVPGLLMSGVIFTGGTGTTTFPHLLIQPTGATASTTWSTSGTAFGINLNVDAGNFVDFCADGASRFSVTAGGAITIASSGILTRAGSLGYFSATSFGLNAATVMDWDNNLFLVRKAAATLQLGLDAAGVTNQVLTAANRITSDGVGAILRIAGGSGRGGAGGDVIFSTYTTGASGAAGVLTDRLFVDAATGMLQFGAKDNSAPGLDRFNLTLRCRLADNSGDAPFSAANYAASGQGGVTAGPFTVITSITVTGGIVTDLQGS